MLTDTGISRPANVSADAKLTGAGGAASPNIGQSALAQNSLLTPQEEANGHETPSARRHGMQQSSTARTGSVKPGTVRSLFISDTHLGCRHAQADQLLDLLNHCQPEQLYIVGDFIDGWKLKRKWRWLPVYDQILQRLMVLKRHGTKLYYTPGNHDNFMRGFLANFGVIEVRDRFIHEAADGRRYVVTHGDQFDRIEKNHQWLSLIASYAYDVMLTANWLGNRMRGKKHDPYAFCGAIKRRVKRLVKHVSEFEGLLIEDVRSAQCDGVICGHIHAPRIIEVEGIAYLNTGDWVENCSALVEHHDGSFDLFRHSGEAIDFLPAKPQEPQVGPAPSAFEPETEPALVG